MNTIPIYRWENGKKHEIRQNQGLDGLFRANLKAEQAEKRAQSLESLIFMNTRMDKDSKGSPDFGSVIKTSARTDKTNRRGKDLDDAIKVSPKGNGHTTGKQDLNELIKANPETNKSMKRTQDLDKFIKVTPTVNKSAQGLNELINVNPQAVKSTSGNQDLDKFIKVNPEILTTNQRNQDLVNTKVSSVMIGSTQSQHLDNLIKVRPSAPTNTNRDQDPEKLTDMHSYVTINKNGRYLFNGVWVSNESLMNPRQELSMTKSMDLLMLGTMSPQEPLSILMKSGTASAPTMGLGMQDPRTLLSTQGHMWRIVNLQKIDIKKLYQESIYQQFTQLQIGLSLKEICALTAANPWV
uniref:sciellin n=1 Tax=Jaculus jaculus TaxID=51337 RepID=UPI001E1B3E89|nr:sciellin [Jaculus jaculus]